MERKCVKLWCWGCGKAPSGETGDPPCCLGCGEQVGICGEPAGPCGLCLDHCIDDMHGGEDCVRGLSVAERRRKLIDDEWADHKKLQQRLTFERFTMDWDEIERQVMRDLYGDDLDGMDLGLT